MENIKQSLMAMVGGAIAERVDYEVNRIVDNILDCNTSETAKRKLTLTVVFKPTNDRSFVNISAEAKSTLAPATAIETTLMFNADENGVPVLEEYRKQLPGQMDLSGHEEETPTMLKLAQKA